MYSDTQLTVEDAAGTNKPANSKLGDLNAMEDVPDQEVRKTI